MNNKITRWFFITYLENAFVTFIIITVKLKVIIITKVFFKFQDPFFVWIILHWFCVCVRAYVCACEQEAVGDILEELWISYNQIEKLKGIQCLKNLKVLYMSNNLVKDWGKQGLEQVWWCSLSNKNTKTSRGPFSFIAVTGSWCRCKVAVAAPLASYKRLASVNRVIFI